MRAKTRKEAVLPSDGTCTIVWVGHPKSQCQCGLPRAITYSDGQHGTAGGARDAIAMESVTGHHQSASSEVGDGSVSIFYS